MNIESSLRPTILTAALLAAAFPVGATPDAAAWRREVVLGDNAAEFLLMRATWSQPGSHFDSHERLQLERVRKQDLGVLETLVIRDVGYHGDPPDRGDATVTERDVGSVDLASILRTRDFHLAFAEDWGENVAIDSTGMFAFMDSQRSVVLSRAELLAQIPDLGEEPRVTGVAKGGTSPSAYYYSVRSGPCSCPDVDWREDIVLVTEDRVQEALAKLRPHAPQVNRE